MSSNLTISKVRFQWIITAQICPYCNGTPRLTDSKKVYGENSNYGPIWLCVCGAYVGCHPGTNKPLGRLADKELREWKHTAHLHFDLVWKNLMDKGNRQIWSRNRAYKWLAKKLKIPKKYTHIGMMDVGQCKKTVEFCKAVNYQIL